MSERPPDVSRRRFLGGLAVVGAALVPGVVPLLRGRATSEDDAAARLAGLFGDGRDDVAGVGHAYLDQRSDEPGASELVAELLPPNAVPAWPHGLSDERLRADLAAAAAADLQGGRVELVGSWLLSATDARVAALVALASRPR